MARKEPRARSRRNTPTRVLAPPPRIGEDSTELLEWLGRGSDVDALVEKGIVCRP